MPRPGRASAETASAARHRSARRLQRRPERLRSLQKARWCDFGSEEAPGPVVSLVGQLAPIDGLWSLVAEATVEDLPANEIGDYWPAGLSDNGRAWVSENIRSGRTRAQGDRQACHGGIPELDFDQAELKAFGGAMSYSDLDVHYLRPMPPVSGVSGTAVFDQRTA